MGSVAIGKLVFDSFGLCALEVPLHHYTIRVVINTYHWDFVVLD